MVNPRKKPKFAFSGRYLKRIKKRWRHPRGRHHKMREKRKSKGKAPSIGYGAPQKSKTLHPSGMKDVLVHSLPQLQKINPKSEAVRFAGTIGKKKRGIMLKKAKELKLKVLNP